MRPAWHCGGPLCRALAGAAPCSAWNLARREGCNDGRFIGRRLLRCLDRAACSVTARRPTWKSSARSGCSARKGLRQPLSTSNTDRPPSRQACGPGAKGSSSHSRLAWLSRRPPSQSLLSTAGRPRPLPEARRHGRAPPTLGGGQSRGRLGFRPGRGGACGPWRNSRCGGPSVPRGWRCAWRCGAAGSVRRVPSRFSRRTSRAPPPGRRA